MQDVAVKVFTKQEYSDEVIYSFKQEVSLFVINLSWNALSFFFPNWMLFLLKDFKLYGSHNAGLSSFFIEIAHNIALAFNEVCEPRSKIHQQCMLFYTGTSLKNWTF